MKKKKRKTGGDKSSKISSAKRRKAIGQVLRDCRGDPDDPSITQQDIAEALGVAQSNVSRIESGSHTLPLDGLFDVCDAYRIPVVSFLNRFGQKIGK